MDTVRTKIIQMGNSRGIRIPKHFIDQAKLGNEVEIVIQRGRVLILPISRPRQGWEEKFRLMAKHRDDKLLDSSGIE